MSFNNHKSSKYSSGFTLLEMLLVIAIIAILAAIVIVAINPSRQLAQARNAQRASDINALYKALQQYQIDNGEWPWEGSANVPDDDDAYEICDTGNGATGGCIDLSDLYPTYIAALPQNPAGGNYVMALNNGSRVSLGAPGSGENDLDPVFVGNNSYVEEAADTGDGGSDTASCDDLEGDERRVCDLEMINDAIQDFIDDNGHAPYLTAGNSACGDITNIVAECSAAETPGAYIDWGVLADELADYIDPLPTDPCGEACYELGSEEDGEDFFTYYYAAPSAMAYFNGQNPDECSAENGCYSNEAYGLYAQNKEDGPGGILYGFGSW